MRRTINRIFVLTALLFTLSPSIASAFDVAADFSPTQNPNGVWTYGYSTTSGSPFITYVDFDQFFVPNIDGW